MNILKSTVILLSVLCAQAIFADTLPLEKTRADKYLKHLKVIPNSSASYKRIKLLSTRLVRIQPGKGLRIFKISITKLDSTNNEASELKLANVLLKVVLQSKLSDTRKSSLEKQFTRLLMGCECPPTPIPTPLP